MMQSILLWLFEHDLNNILYYGCHALGFLATGLLVAKNAPKMGIEPKTAVLTVIAVYPLLYLWNYVLFWVESGFTSFGGNNIVRLFIYLPLALYPASKINKIPYERLCQLIAPVPCLTHSISHLGCIFAGCCQGIPCPWGIYRVESMDIRFPSQLVEALVAFLIVVLLQKRNEKRRWAPDPAAMPLMLFAFGSTRFLLEFLRDNEKLLWGISALAVHALICALVGASWLLCLRRRGKA